MKYLLILILLFSTSASFSQPDSNGYTATRYYKKIFTPNDKKVMLLQFINGSADGVNQAIQVHGLGIGTWFWDYNTSWKNKYKNYDAGDLRAAYPFSKSALVAGTDGYHLTRFVSRGTMMATVIIDQTDLKSWKIILRKLIICSVTNRLGFYLFYDIIFGK